MATSNHTPTLNACPFCGSTAEIVRPITGSETADADGYFGDVFVGQCHDCLSQGPGGETAEQAAGSWNQRAA